MSHPRLNLPLLPLILTPLPALYLLKLLPHNLTLMAPQVKI